MEIHRATMMFYKTSNRGKKELRFFKTACKRKMTSRDGWSKPTDVTVYIEKVTCEECLRVCGMELLQNL